jgi:hypothetical protein
MIGSAQAGGNSPAFRLGDVLAALDAAAPAARETIISGAMSATAGMAWVPNPGPQASAYFCDADELFYGGQAGGGKSDLGIGLALTAHSRSLILREYNDDARSLGDRLLAIVGNTNGWNGQLLRYKTGERLVEFGGCQHEEDKQRYKGDPHSLIVFDEVGDFSESQYVFIGAWNRSATGERSRIVATGNPPTRAKGLWVIRRWAAWLDPKHPNPAKPGELRYYTTSADGGEIEVDGSGPHLIDGEMVTARSRTFIPARLDDNPDLSETNYGAMLASLPKELRDAYRDGKFAASLKDQPNQLLPTEWLRAAQARWKPEGFKGFAMTAMALDPAGGGRDSAEIACRYGGWYAPLITAKGKETADGSATAGTVIAHRRDACPVVIDTGGGYGGSVTMRLKDNGIEPHAYNGSNKSHAKTKDGQLHFLNKRAEVHWKFREALDPDQEGGSVIALPPDDSELFADLCALTWSPEAKGIQIVSKEKLRELLGRSPGKGDAVIMALSEGNHAIAKQHNRTSGKSPQVNRGHQAARRR